MKFVHAILSGAILLFSAPALAAELSGQARAVDSDVIDIAGQRIMLFGLESVERNQTCSIEGKVWQCWPAAVRHLEHLLAQGSVTCRQVGEPDRYGRILGHCEINGKSLNEAYVRSGFAVAREDETKEFVPAEKAAARERIGLWQGKFMKPWDFRLASGILVDRP